MTIAQMNERGHAFAGVFGSLLIFSGQGAAASRAQVDLRLISSAKIVSVSL